MILYIAIYYILQIYSVRVRDKGPDYRGFVQLDCSNNNNNSSNCNYGSDLFENNDPLSECPANGSDSNNISATATSTIAGNNSIIAALEGSSVGGNSVGGSLRFPGSTFESSSSSNLDSIADLSDPGLLLSSSSSHSSLLPSNAIGRNSSLLTNAQCHVDSCHKLSKNVVSRILLLMHNWFFQLKGSVFHSGSLPIFIVQST